MNLSAYFPRVITEWQQEAPSVRSRVFHGSLVFMDISGFTAMSERLAKKGKVGAEEITDILDERFSSLLEAAYLEGGSLLKFGGDAMLLLFVGEQHERRACRAAAQMRTRLNRTGRVATSNGTVHLRMSVGVHSGEIHMFLVGSSHRELIVAGPAVTRTVEMEGAAAAGEIRVSEVTARALPEGYMQEAPGGGWLLTKAPAGTGGAPAPAPAQRELAGAERFISPAIRAHLTATSARESEHRYAVVCFIHYEGVDGLLERGGVAAVERALSELVETVQRATDEHGLCFLASDIDRDGGKIIVTGGVPTTSGSDEEGMLRAVAQILAAKTELHVHIGINGGPVFAGDKGTLTLSASEEGANVYVDDALIGTTPLKGGVSLSGGHHLIAVEKAGFIRYAEAVRVEAGAQLKRDLRLVPSLEFLEEYRATNGLLRALAWASTAAAGISGVVAGVTWGGFVVTRQEQDRVNAKWIARQPIPSTDEAQALRETQDASSAVEPWSYGVGVAGPAFLITAAAAGASWLFGDDPTRYDNLGETTPSATP